MPKTLFLACQAIMQFTIAICIAVCDDEQFMCDMIEEKIKEMLPDAVVCKFFFGAGTA